MGLLSRITSGIDLSSLEVEISQKDESFTVDKPVNKLSFFEFTAKNSLSRAAIFKKNGIFYSLCASKGFDGESILQSISTSDFWEGTIKENTWNYFSHEDNNLNAMLQFFSPALKPEISFVEVYLSTDFILLISQNEDDISKIPSKENLDVIAKDFLNTDCFLSFKDINNSDTNPENLFTFSFNISDAVSHMTGKLSQDIKENISNAFITETYAVLKNLLLQPGIIPAKTDNPYSFSFSVNSECHITQNAMKEFLYMIFKPLFKEYTDLVNYE